MKRTLLLLVLMTTMFSFNAMSQCGQVGLIGEMTGWQSDIMMTRDMGNPDVFTAIITVDTTMDGDASGFVEMKFRANQDWATNWGSADFPTGTAVADGANIPVPYGTYTVSFNCTTGEYAFGATCDVISLIGEFNGWADDLLLTRSDDNANDWFGFITVDTTMDDDASGFVEMKFRAGGDWATNWGAADFPTGTATQDGANIPVPYGTYQVDFNCETGVYTFTTTCKNIGLIGEFNGWAEDYWMIRGDNADEWSVILTLTADMDGDANDTIEMKFRAGADWGTNWGGAGFPSGTGVQDGPNIKVPLTAEGTTTDYAVTFNCSTGEYNFLATSGDISMIGAFNNWNGDVPMNRDADNPNMWTVTRSWYADSEVKFRENADWTVNWGSAAWPTGTGEPNGANIPLVAGTYDVTFDYASLEYNFTTNTDACGEVGMVGDFNEWGGTDAANPTDVFLERDALYPSQFSLTYNFTSSTLLLFRIDADPAFADVWGGSFPSGQAVNDAAVQINVPGGKYLITYNCLSHDFAFERLGNAIVAPEVFAIDVDGNLNEADWDIYQPVSAVADGTPIETPIEVYFGAAWNSEYMYVGVNVTDATVTDGDIVEVFFDGDKSGGNYGPADVHMTVTSAGVVTVVQGTEGIEVLGAAKITDAGYSVEVGIPFATLGVTPETGAQAGIDVIVGDDNGEGVVYQLVWNGGLQNHDETSSFGDLNYGTLSCGCVSVHNETIGDVKLRNQLAYENTTIYVGTYEFDAAYDLVFRKDGSSTVSWSNDAFPEGTAVLAGPVIPATDGRYRITFNCITGEYSFGDALSGDAIAMSPYTENPPVIDGDLSEFDLAYGSEILAAGEGPINNTVTWGTMWDADNLYIAAHVVDAVVEGGGNPWDNDAIEMYIDGDNSKDGTYSAESFDTQLIMDAVGLDSLWQKADGVPITDETSKWLATSDGYSIEIRLGWEQLGFAPGKGRTIGWSLGNNDADNGIGRDYQTVWYGNGNNWSDNTLLGDLQLQGGPYYVDGIDEHVLYNANIVLYPNPTTGNVTLRSMGDVFNSQAVIYVADITGRIISQTNANFVGNSNVSINIGDATTGIYFVNIISEDGKRAVKKLMVK